MKPRCFQIHERDNVATMIGDAMNGAIEVIGKDAGEIVAVERIASGQKIALRDIAKDEAIVKFGVRIGHATAPSAVGHGCICTTWPAILTNVPGRWICIPEHNRHAI